MRGLICGIGISNLSKSLFGFSLSTSTITGDFPFVPLPIGLYWNSTPSVFKLSTNSKNAGVPTTTKFSGVSNENIFRKPLPMVCSGNILESAPNGRKPTTVETFLTSQPSRSIKTETTALYGESSLSILSAALRSISNSSFAFFVVAVSFISPELLVWIVKTAFFIFG